MTEVRGEVLADLPHPVAFVRTGPQGPVAVVRNEVRIYDTDASTLIFYGATTRFFHDAQMTLFRHLGYRPAMLDGEGSSTVVRASSFELRAPLRMGDVFDSEAWVAERGRTSIVCGHRVISQGRVCLFGTTSFVNVDLRTMVPAPLPPELQAVVPQGLEAFQTC